MLKRERNINLDTISQKFDIATKYSHFLLILQQIIS